VTDGGAQDRGDHRQRIDAEVEQWSAGQLGVEDPVVAGEVLGVLATDRSQATERAGLQQLADDVPLGQVQRPQRLGAVPAGPRGDVGDAPGVGTGRGDRLLHQHVLARLHRGDRQLGVGVVGGGHVDDVDLRVRQHGVVALDRVSDVVLGGERRRALDVTRAGDGDLLTGVLLQRLHESLGDPPGSDHAPPQGRRLHRVGRARRRHRGREAHGHQYGASGRIVAG
jgi:hypothetical protein